MVFFLSLPGNLNFLSQSALFTEKNPVLVYIHFRNGYYVSKPIECILLSSYNCLYLVVGNKVLY